MTSLCLYLVLMVFRTVLCVCACVSCVCVHVCVYRGCEMGVCGEERGGFVSRGGRVYGIELEIEEEEIVIGQFDTVVW